MNFLVTSAKVADNNDEVLYTLLGKFTGKCYPDKGYLSKLFESFYQQRLRLVIKLRKNMKNQLVSLGDKLRLKNGY